MTDDSLRAAGDRMRSGVSPRRLFWLTLAGFFVVLGCWSLANPLMAATDEPSHAIKAAAAVRLDLLPDRVGDNGLGVTRIPALFAQASQQTCIAFHPDSSARCQPGFTGNLQATVPAVTSVPQGNPLYYLLVGWPSLLPVGTYTLYVMRLIGALLVAALAAMSVRTLAEFGGARWILLGTVAALTPMTVFLGSTINPHGVEVMAGLTVWVTLLALLRLPDPGLTRPRLLRLTVATVFFVSAQGFSPLLLLIIIALAALSSPRGRIVELITARYTWPYLIVCAGAGLVAVAWVLIAASRDYGFVDPPAGPGFLAGSIGLTSRYLMSMIGVFGWLDTELPGWVYLAAAALIGGTLMLGLAIGRVWERVLILGLAAVVLLFPVAVRLVEGEQAVFWQGSYVLPLLVGIPILAGFAAHEEDAVPGWIVRNLLRIGIATMAVVQFAAFGVNLHRYVNGAAAGWLRRTSASWEAPVNPYLLLIVAAAGWIALGMLLGRIPTVLLPVANPPEHRYVDDHQSETDRADLESDGYTPAEGEWVTDEEAQPDQKPPEDAPEPEEAAEPGAQRARHRADL